MGSGAAVAVWAVRSGVRWRASAEAAGVQRGYADVATGGGGGAVVLPGGSLSEAGPIQFAARAVDRAMEGADAVSAGQPRGLLLDGRSGRRDDGDLSAGYGAAGWVEDVDFPDR